MIGNGIQLSTGFDLSSQVPLDSRDTVADIAERDAIPGVMRFKGLKVTVQDDGGGQMVTYILSAQSGTTIDNTDWEVYVGSGGSFWSRNSTDGFLYPTTLTDYVGIGRDDVTKILDISTENLDPYSYSFASSVVGLNDATFTIDPGYSYLGNNIYYVQIDSTGTPDTFKWYSTSAGSFTNNVPITGSPQLLDNGVYVTFGATTGHTLDDFWLETIDYDARIVNIQNDDRSETYFVVNKVADLATAIGISAGYLAHDAEGALFIGNSSGAGATSAADSVFLGNYAGENATNAYNSNFIGYLTGSDAASANFSNFIGTRAGKGATNASSSTFIGSFSGEDATNAKNSIFIGQNSGVSDTVDNTSSGWSILIGNYTHTGGFQNSVLLGGGDYFTQQSNTKDNQFMLADTITEVRWSGVEYTLPTALGSAGYVLTDVAGDGVLTWEAGGGTGGNFVDVDIANNSVYSGLIGAISLDNSTFLGKDAGASTTDAYYSVFIGDEAGNGAISAVNSNFIGTQSGWGATDAYGSSFMGWQAGYEATGAHYSVFIGNEAGSGATAAENAVIIGNAAGVGATDATQGIFIGALSGFQATDAYNGIFMGTYAGYQAANARSGIFIGNEAGKSDTVNNTASGWSILLGEYTNTGGFQNSILLGSGTGSMATIANTADDQFMVADSISNYRFHGVEYLMPGVGGSVGDALTITDDTGGIYTLDWQAGGGGVPTTITVASETSDTTSFVGFFTDETGNLQPKTNPNLRFNASTSALGLGAAPDARLTVSEQSTIQAAVSGSTAHFVGTDANPLRLTFDTHNNSTSSGTAFMVRRSRGTSTTPSAVQSGDILASYNARGYGTSQYAAGSTGLISMVATETFTNTANGTAITFSTTPDGSVTAAETARIISTGLTLTPATLTGSQTNSAIDLAQTWNTSGLVNALKMNITNTASNSGSTGILIQEGGANRFRFLLASASIAIGSGNNNTGFGTATATTGAGSATGNALRFYSQVGTTSTNQGYDYWFTPVSARQPTSGTSGGTRWTGTFSPTSGTGTYDHFSLAATINQTGGASGITRGIYIDPVLTAAADWRSLEITNNSGKGVYQTGASATNNFVGKTLFGATGTPATTLHTISTTEQYRNGYDASNYMSFTTASTGSTTFALTGTSPTFTFSNSVNVSTFSLSVGTASTAARLVSTYNSGDQLRLAYDGSNYTTFQVGSGGDMTITPTGGDISIGGNVKLNSSGNGLYIAEGSNATMGTATLSGGTVTVNNTKVTANTRIFLTVGTLGTVAVAQAVAVTARSVGTSFTITSAGITDTSVVQYLLVEPN
jgi:hypothetical protein